MRYGLARRSTEFCGRFWLVQSFIFGDQIQNPFLRAAILRGENLIPAEAFRCGFRVAMFRSQRLTQTHAAVAYVLVIGGKRFRINVQCVAKKRFGACVFFALDIDSRKADLHVQGHEDRIFKGQSGRRPISSFSRSRPELPGVVSRFFERRDSVGPGMYVGNSRTGLIRRQYNRIDHRYPILFTGNRVNRNYVQVLRRQIIQ